MHFIENIYWYTMRFCPSCWILFFSELGAFSSKTSIGAILDASVYSWWTVMFYFISSCSVYTPVFGDDSCTFLLPWNCPAQNEWVRVHTWALLINIHPCIRGGWRAVLMCWGIGWGLVTVHSHWPSFRVRSCLALTPRDPTKYGGFGNPAQWKDRSPLKAAPAVS